MKEGKGEGIISSPARTAPGKKKSQVWNGSTIKIFMYCVCIHVCVTVFYENILNIKVICFFIYIKMKLFVDMYL